jgi:hypothetical protein
MTLGQFSVAVGAPKRWVQNAMAVLGLPTDYTVERAKRLALARVLNAACGMPLVKAYRMAGTALKAWPEHSTWQFEDPEGVVTLSLDLERFLSNFNVRLSLSRTYYAERRRGRPKKRRRRGIAGAREYGIDISLLEESLKRTPEERLRRLDEDVEFLKSLRVAEP